MESIVADVCSFVLAGNSDMLNVSISVPYGVGANDHESAFTTVGVVPIETARAFAAQVTAMISGHRSWKPLPLLAVID